MENSDTTNGTLQLGEIHPAAHNAFKYVKDYLTSDLKNAFMLKESLASTALEGSRLSEVCLETLNRILRGDVVSDRYLLGLAWLIKMMIEEERTDYSF